ncbi:AraC family transcriptional regulator [Pararhodobacter sp.]|uniref:AraC family transcriptional regulator n=1 Tax=Pararhodobacter sp. TaxID=2127056 RepID=UPI002FE1FB9D
MQQDAIGGFVEEDSPVIGVVTGFTPATMPETHAHRRGQLAWCPDRPVTVETGAALHLVAPGTAIWLPPGHPHRIRAAGARQSVNLYTQPGAAPLPAEPAPFLLAALERELVLALAEASRADRREPAFARLVAVLWDRLDHPSATPSLPLPADPRLRRIALAHLDGDDTALDRWAGTLGLSRRSLQRLVTRETGQNWAGWTRALRLARGLAPLMAGQSVQSAAHAAGYATASGFVAAFHAAHGVTPGQLQRRIGG